jgi:hypothetical protein
LVILKYWSSSRDFNKLFIKPESWKNMLRHIFWNFLCCIKLRCDCFLYLWETWAYAWKQSIVFPNIYIFATFHRKPDILILNTRENHQSHFFFAGSSAIHVVGLDLAGHCCRLHAWITHACTAYCMNYLITFAQCQHHTKCKTGREEKWLTWSASSLPLSAFVWSSSCVLVCPWLKTPVLFVPCVRSFFFPSSVFLFFRSYLSASSMFLCSLLCLFLLIFSFVDGLVEANLLPKR